MIACNNLWKSCNWVWNNYKCIYLFFKEGAFGYKMLSKQKHSPIWNEIWKSVLTVNVFAGDLWPSLFTPYKCININSDFFGKGKQSDPSLDEIPLVFRKQQIAFIVFF